MSDEQLPRPLDDLSPGRPARLTLLNLVIGLAGVAVGLTSGLALHDRFPVFFATSEMHAQVLECNARILAIATAMETHRMKYQRYPTSQYELVPEFLSELPQCPRAGRVTYRTSFTAARPDGSRGYKIECCGTSHSNLFLAPNFPAYDSIQGLRLEWAWR